VVVVHLSVATRTRELPSGPKGAGCFASDAESRWGPLLAAARVPLRRVGAAGQGWAPPGASPCRRPPSA